MKHLIICAFQASFTIFITLNVVSLGTGADDVVEPMIMVLPTGTDPQSLAAGREGVIGFRNGASGGKHAWNWLRVFPDKGTTEVQTVFRDGTFAVILPTRDQSLVYYQNENVLRLIDIHNRVVKESRWSGGYVLSLKADSRDQFAVLHSVESKSATQQIRHQIAVVDLDTLAISRPIEGMQPVIMTDPATILFHKVKTAPMLHESVLYRTEPSLSSVKTVRTFAPPLVQPTVSFDGRFIAGVSLTGKENDQPLVLFDTQKDSVRILSEPGARCTEPLFSPNKLNLLAYRVHIRKNDARTAAALVVYALDGRRIVVEKDPTHFSESYCWSHDGLTFFWIVGPRSAPLLKSYRVQPTP